MGSSALRTQGFCHLLRRPVWLRSYLLLLFCLSFVCSCPLQNSCWNLVIKVTILKGGSLRRWWNLVVRTLMNRIRCHLLIPLALLLPVCHVRTAILLSGRHCLSSHPGSREQTLIRCHACWHFYLRLLVPRTVRNSFLFCVNYVVYGLFVDISQNLMHS